MSVSVVATPMINECLFPPVSVAGKRASKMSQVCKKGNIRRYVANTINLQSHLILIFINISLRMAITISCIVRPTSTKVVWQMAKAFAEKAWRDDCQYSL